MSLAASQSATEPSPGLQKRSLTLEGHRTSVALEAEFWAALERLAEVRGLSLSRLVAQVDTSRGERPLASALRVYALRAAAAR
jgi:predicted DNA-binding ribbon-helix-helix protein